MTEAIRFSTPCDEIDVKPQEVVQESVIVDAHIDNTVVIEEESDIRKESSSLLSFPTSQQPFDDNSLFVDQKVDTNENHFDEPHAVTEDAMETTEAEAEETMEFMESDTDSQKAPTLSVGG